MNVGYAESLRDLDFDCFVFHDVDLILENDNAIYSCPERPRHLSTAVDKFNYDATYNAIFGKQSKENLLFENMNNNTGCFLKLCRNFVFGRFSCFELTLTSVFSFFTLY